MYSSGPSPSSVAKRVEMLVSWNPGPPPQGPDPQLRVEQALFDWDRQVDRIRCVNSLAHLRRGDPDRVRSDERMKIGVNRTAKIVSGELDIWAQTLQSVSYHLTVIEQSLVVEWLVPCIKEI